MAGSALIKFLSQHKPHCKMWEFNLQEKRLCTCGKEKAERELETMIRILSQMEFCADGGWDMVCPICQGEEHKQDCELGKLLKKLRSVNERAH